VFSGGTNNDSALLLNQLNDLTLNLGDGINTTSIVKFTSGGEQLDDTDWHHVLISVDTSNTSNRHVYFDDSSMGGSWDIYTVDSIIDYTVQLNIGRRGVNNTRYLKGYLADVWIDFDNYIDFSVEANRRKFISAAGLPVNLGSDGSLPTGSAPEVFLSGPAADWHTNKGTGGGFSEVGELTDAPDLEAEGSAGTCSTAGEFYYNFTNDRMQWCDGSDLHNMSTEAGSGSCSPEGAMRFEDYCYEFCDGNGWVSVGACTDTNNSLLAHWKLDETGGGTTTAADSAGSNTGTMQNGLTGADSVTGKVDTALSFNGSNEDIDAGTASLIEGNDEASVCAWTYLASASVTTDNAMLSKSATDWWLFWIDDSAYFAGTENTVAFSVDVDAGADGRIEGTTDAVTPQTWQHFCGVFRGGNYIRLYRDGVMIAQNTTNIVSNVVSVPTTELYIGSDGSSKYFNGYLDDVRIYDKALSDSEVEAIYNLGD
jgi:hypothetical protein